MTASVSAAEIARALGVSRTTVGDWETGRRVPTAAHALAYGRLLRDLAKLAA
jgi:DNA-binding transcriptional regulator YiaG